jgi:hypothetical protein
MWLNASKSVAICFLLPMLLLIGCGDDAPEPAALGESCDSSADTPCKSDYVCADDGDGTNRCLADVGNACDPDAEDAHCVPNADCFANEAAEDDEDAPAGLCLVTEGNECTADDPMCAPDLTCAEREDGSNACYPPVYIEGSVRDSSDDQSIEGAHIIGLDDKKVAVTDVAVSDADGNYQLALPVVRTSEGAPVDSSFTLRADAADYQTFPGGLRTALPINTSTAESTEAGWVISGTPTEIVLIPLPDAEQGNPSVSGEILADDGDAGVLVVASGDNGTFSAVSDREGHYTIFNVGSGDYEVRGYAAGLQLTPEQVTMAADPLEDVDLSVSDDPLSTLSGSVNIVNAPGGSMTSVVLVVDDTFDETFVRGEVPPGLRAPETGAPSITGGWTIESVPAGDYVVLAAFENDELVRDPDQNIAGTHIVRVTIDPSAGDTDVELGDSFKITEALDVVSPGAERPEMVSAAPTLTWADDSSEDFYTVEVYNSYGDLVWDNDGQQVDRVTGSDDVTISYGGPTESGMYYQFRAKSWKGDSPISATEDLRGVFFFE